MKTFVIGDIHGAYQALLQCLERSKFDANKDRLICLGDVCDRGKQIRECVDKLLTIPNCVFIMGNHDNWTLKWAIDGKDPQGWLEQGGAQTAASYKDGMPKEHIQFFSQAPYYFVDENRLYVHGGFDPDRSLADTPKEFFAWDRSLLEKSRQLHHISPEWKYGDYDDIFIGHTPTLSFGKIEPQKFCNVWDLDTGAGWGAKLTIMDVETKKFWQSDPVSKSLSFSVDGGGKLGVKE